jgi:5,10-methylenetetrahydrofolate reductase
MSEQTNGYKSGSNLEKLLRAGHFVVTAEIGPPQSADPEVIRRKARLLKGVVDATNITDNQTAIVRMSSIASAVLAMQEGVEPIVQMTCRDRNRLAMQSDLLGAYALGARNLLCLTGDHQSFGNHPTAKNVHDLDSIQFIRMVRDMRDEGRFQCGDEIKGVRPRFFIGAAENPFGDPFDFRPYRLMKKVAAGWTSSRPRLFWTSPAFGSS